MPSFHCLQKDLTGKWIIQVVPPHRGPGLNISIISGLISWDSSAAPSVSSQLYSYITVLLWAAALPDRLMSLATHWHISEFHRLCAKGRRRVGTEPVRSLHRGSLCAALRSWSLQCAVDDGTEKGQLQNLNLGACCIFGDVASILLNPLLSAQPYNVIVSKCSPRTEVHTVLKCPLSCIWLFNLTFVHVACRLEGTAVFFLIH